MEIQKQRNLISPNRVNFSQQDQQQTTLIDRTQEPRMNQETIKQIDAETKSRIFLSSQQNWDIEILKEKLSKLIQFITFHNIDHTEIWSRKKQLSISYFARLLNENYGFYLTNDQLTALLKICSKKEYMKPSDFQPFSLWLEEPNPFNLTRYSANLSSQTIHIKKPHKSNKTSQNELNNSYNCTAQNLLIPRENIRKNFEAFKSSFNLGKTYANEGFKKAQKYSKAKVQMKVQQLKKDIKESVLEKKWDFIVMAGEMNQWIDQLKKQAEKQGQEANTQNFLSYRFKVLNRDPVEIIQQNTDTRTSESIPHVVFIKKYQTLKKKIVKQENNKNNLKGTVLMVLQDQDKFSKNVLVNRINQRDQQLNFVLLQIMRMKSMFQWQNNILKEAKINS